MPERQLARRNIALPAFDLSKLPEGIDQVINVPLWAESLITGKPYREPDPEFISKMLAFQVVTADTIEDVFRAQGIRQLQNMLADTPDASTGNIEITDLYVAESDFETGNPSYVIITYTSLEDGEEVKFSTGATNVQSTILALLRLGMWPIRCRIVRGTQKDKGGHHLLFVLPIN